MAVEGGWRLRGEVAMEGGSGGGGGEVAMEGGRWRWRGEVAVEDGRVEMVVK